MVSEAFSDRLAVGGHAAGLDRRARAGPAFEQAALDQQHVRALAGRGFAVARLSAKVSSICRAARSAARRTQASNEVRSCQISAGRCRGVTSRAPCRSSAWIIMRLSGRPKSSTVSPSPSIRWPPAAFVTVIGSRDALGIDGGIVAVGETELAAAGHVAEFVDGAGVGTGAAKRRQVGDDRVGRVHHRLVALEDRKRGVGGGKIDRIVERIEPASGHGGRRSRPCGARSRRHPAGTHRDLPDRFSWDYRRRVGASVRPDQNRKLRLRRA